MFTKASVTILIGSPPDATDNNYFVKVLNSGKTLDGKDFHDWDREGFKVNVLHHFVRFLSQTSGANFFFLFLHAIHLFFYRWRRPHNPRTFCSSIYGFWSFSFSFYGLYSLLSFDFSSHR